MRRVIKLTKVSDDQTVALKSYGQRSIKYLYFMDSWTNTQYIWCWVTVLFTSKRSHD